MSYVNLSRFRGGKVADKKFPVKRVGNQVCIPVRKEGTVYDNFELVAQLVEDWKLENPTEQLASPPEYHITPASGTRSITVNSITFTLKE